MSESRSLPGKVDRVAAMVCTHDRLPVLFRCIDSLLAQDLPEGVKLDIVIADNSAQSLESSIRARYPKAHYVHQPARGYSNIRNAALECMLRNSTAQVLVFLDDDLAAFPDLVAQHLATMVRHDADVVGGQLGPRARVAEGAKLKKVSTSNIAFRRWIAERLRFCPEANLLGVEDHEFFAEAMALGARTAVSLGLVGENRDGLASIDLPLVRYASARNAIRLAVLRRGRHVALAAYVRQYVMRLPRGLLLVGAGSAFGKPALVAKGRENLDVHRGAWQGLYRPGLDRELAKQGKIVEVE